MADNVVNISDFRETQTTPIPTGLEPSVRIDDGSDGSKKSEQMEFVSPSRLYPLGEPQKLDLQQTLKLIEEADSHISAASEAIEANDQVAAELAMQHLKAVMPELFCHRKIGDGFASLVSCIFYSIKNHGNLEFEIDQVSAIRFAIRRVGEDPFIPFEGSQELIDGLEKAGFSVEPPELEGLSEILDGQSLR